MTNQQPTSDINPISDETSCLFFLSFLSFFLSLSSKDSFPRERERERERKKRKTGRKDWWYNLRKKEEKKSNWTKHITRREKECKQVLQLSGFFFSLSLFEWESIKNCFLMNIHVRLNDWITIFSKVRVGESEWTKIWISDRTITFFLSPLSFLPFFLS